MMQFRGLGDGVVTTVDPTMLSGPSFTGEPVSTENAPVGITESALANMPVFDVTGPTASSLSLAAAAGTPQTSSMWLWAGAGIFVVMLLLELRK
jgi:hypothetical protein